MGQTIHKPPQSSSSFSSCSSSIHTIEQQLKEKELDNKSIYTLYGILIIQLITLEIDEETFGDQYLALKTHEQHHTVEDCISSYHINNLMQCIGLLRSFPVSSSSSISLIQNGVHEIKHSSYIRLVLIAKLNSIWPELRISPSSASSSHLYKQTEEWLYSKAEIIENESYSTEEERTVVCCIFILYVFIQWRSSFDDLVINDNNDDDWTKTTFELIKQCEQIERLLVKSPSPKDDLDFNQFLKNTSKFNEIPNKFNYAVIIRLNRITGIDCFTIVETYMKQFISKLKPFFV